MEEWKEYKLGDIAKVTMGQSPKSSYYNNTGEGIPFMQGNRTFGIKYPTFDTYTSKATKIAEANDVIMSVRAPVGDINITPVQMCLGRGLCGIRLNNDNQEFLYYLLRYHSKLLINKESGTVFGSINRNDISNLRVKIPNDCIQIIIAKVLSSLDDKIEINRRINENLELQAQALFKSWLSNCHEEVTIGQLSQNITDYTRCNHPKVVLINSSDVTEGRFEHHNYSENKNLKGHFKKRFQKGDILYSQVRPRNRHWGYCSFNADDYLASTQLMVIRNRNGVITSHLLYQYLIDDSVWMDFTNKTETRSGTFPQGNFEELSSIKVPFGANTKKISAQLDCIYAKVYNNEEQINVLASLRDTLLPRLMSGELKVNEIEQ